MNQSGGSIEDRLQTLVLVSRKPCECRVAVVEAWHNQRYDQRLIHSCLTNHSVARQCLHCCNINQPIRTMEIAKFRGGGGGRNPKTPEPIDQKFGIDDYVGENSLHAKTQNERPIRAWRRMREISPSRGF